jgi:hypothetical protein
MHPLRVSVSNNNDFGFWVSMIGLGMAAWALYAGPRNLWHSFEYGVSADKVRVEAQPTDCDFMTAPLGRKGCHYEAAVTAFNAAGYAIPSERANRTPQYAQDKTGAAIVSYDHRKTWEYAANIPDPAITSVLVSWGKVKD